MAKPTRIQHGGVGIYLNDKQADRVQTFGSSTALNTEDLKEVGNKNIVEVIDGIPTVDVTLDSNQYGSGKTLAQLANLNFDYAYCQIAPSGALQVDVTAGDYFMNEMKYNHTATSLEFSAEVAALAANQAQIICVEIGVDNVPDKNPGTAFTIGGTPDRPATTASHLKLGEVYLVDSLTEITDDYIANFHDIVTITEGDYEYAKVDIVAPVKEVGDNTTTDDIIRTMYMENAFCNRVDLAFNTDGLSTENFSLETDNKRWFLNGARAVVVDRFRTVAATFTLTETPTQLANLNYTLKARVFDSATGLYRTLTEATAGVVADTYSINPAGPSITLLDGNLGATETLIVRYCADPAALDVHGYVSFKMLPDPKEAHPDPAGGIKQGQVEIYIVGPSPDGFTPAVTTDYSPGEGYFTLRLESATITCELAREALNEIGHALPYDRPLTLPVPVTLALNAKSTDLEEFARYMEARNAWNTNTLNEASIDRLSKDLAVQVYIFRETDTKRDEVPFMFQPWLKLIEVNDVAVTDEAFEISVDANATQTFSMKADNFTIKARA
jgi:hypothetical protein